MSFKSKMNIRVAWMFPDILNLYGDLGNIKAIEKIANDHSIDINIDKISFNTKDFNIFDYNLIYFPPGEIRAMESIIDFLVNYREDLKNYISSGKVIISIGNTNSVFYDKYFRKEREFNGLGLIEGYSKEKNFPYGDDIISNVNFNNKNFEVIGSQIQMMDFYPKNYNKFGDIEYGYGNNGEDKQEGVRINNSFFTNINGPILALNPLFTYEIINLLTNSKYEMMPEKLEKVIKNHEEKSKFIMEKPSPLK